MPLFQVYQPVSASTDFTIKVKEAFSPSYLCQDLGWGGGRGEDS